jgi:hypothetical protein
LSIAVRLFLLVTAVDTTKLALLSRTYLYFPSQNGVRRLANDGAGGAAGSRKQGNETTVEAECVLLGYLPIAVDAHVSLLHLLHH